MNHKIKFGGPGFTGFHQNKTNRDKTVFRAVVIITWVLLAAILYPLWTYNSTNALVWDRHSVSYTTGLVVHLSIVALWLLLLALPEYYIKLISRSITHLKSDTQAHGQFLVFCTFLLLLTFSTTSIWEWAYNAFLQINLLILGLWVCLIPTFWDWGLTGWPKRIHHLSITRIQEQLAQNWSQWLTVIVGIGVLLGSYGLGTFASQKEILLLIGLLAGLGSVLIFMYWPGFGLVSLIATALIVPSPSLPGGLNVAVLQLGLLIGLWLLDVIFGQREIRFYPSRTTWPLLALVVAATISLGLGQLRWFSFATPAPLDAQLGGWAIFVLAAGAFLLVGNQVKDLRLLQWLTWTFLAFGAIFIAGWLIPPLEPVRSALFQNGTHNNSMFWVWIVTLSFSQALINQKLPMVWRVMIGGLALATLYVAFVLNDGWKSGYLPPLVSVAVIIGLRSWRTGLVVALGGIIPAMTLSSEAIASDEYSYDSRLDAWIIMLKMIKINPFFGFGPANYYWYTPLFPIRGYAVRFNSHNQYIDIVAQTGLLGLFCVLWFAWEVAWLGWRLKEQLPEGFAKAYAYGALGGLAATLASGVLVDWFLPFAYNVGLTGFRASMMPWLFLGGLVSIERIYRNQLNAEPAAKR